jgi:prepilin-type processing-associated H-X9-DG protein
MQRRLGFSLTDLLAVMTIIGILLALFLPTFAKVRAAALLAVSKNNLRQIMVAAKQHASDHNAFFPHAGNKPSDSKVLEQLIPYIDPPLHARRSARQMKKTHDVYKADVVHKFIDPADWSVQYEFEQALFRNAKFEREFRARNGPDSLPAGEKLANIDDYYGEVSSYAANAQVFNSPAKVPTSFGDGMSNTITFGQHFAVIHAAIVMRDVGVHFSWADQTNPMKSTIGLVANTGHFAHVFREASFADKVLKGQPYAPHFDDVIPITQNHVTNGSIPNMHFQVNPRMKEADVRVCQTPHNAGMPVAMADGSVRVLAHSIKPGIFWSLVTPNGGEDLNIQ